MTTPRRRASAPRRRRNSNRKWIILIIALLLVFLLLLGGVVYYFMYVQPAQKRVSGGEREAAALQGSINQMTEEEIQEALDNIVEEGMFRISIASNIIAIEDEPAQVRIENHLQNRYVMQVSMYLDETGEEIYRTGLIDPGYYIPEAPLAKHLDPGVYPATAVFTALYPDTEEIVGTVGAQVKLHVYDAVPTPTPSPTPTPTPAPTPEAAGAQP